MTAMPPATLLDVLPARHRPEPTCEPAIIVSHARLSPAIFRLVLHAPHITASAQAGQFVMLSVPEVAGRVIQLPRPMAIHRRHRDAGDIEVIYNVQGPGTDALSRAREGGTLLVTGPLGRGFDIPGTATSLLLIGRGIGICSFMTLVEDAAGAAIASTAVLSARTGDRVIGRSDCDQLGAKAIPVTDSDGSSSVEAVDRTLTGEFAGRPPGLIVVCGSQRLTELAMDLSARWQVPLQVSLEAHMACGLGYCHGCAIPYTGDSFREGPLVCHDGPVFAVRSTHAAV
ncbi:hypothetical protein [Dactylosporangium salmoneum]|uniref:Dihydroorotate dehydrogenase electron transfer subunit n=1 Tax=Dactylosporangium salmoneum TaxID=53361 RepID=A0ABP5SYY5_9ACTN